MSHNELRRMQRVVDPRMECQRLERLVADLDRQLCLLVADNLKLDARIEELEVIVKNNASCIRQQQQWIAGLDIRVNGKTKWTR